MQYNTQRSLLRIDEYGRNVQTMINHAKTIESKEDRNNAAEAIISVMSIVSPNAKQVEDYKEKLWNHLMMLSNFELDVDCPYEIDKSLMDGFKPVKVDYPDHKMKYRHYGKGIERLIAEGGAIEDLDRRQEFARMAANLLKRTYLAWNRDSVNDELILEQLRDLSGGKLNPGEDFKFVHTSDLLAQYGTNVDHKSMMAKNNGRAKKNTKKKNFRKKY